MATGHSSQSSGDVAENDEVLMGLMTDLHRHIKSSNYVQQRTDELKKENPSHYEEMKKQLSEAIAELPNNFQMQDESTKGGDSETSMEDLLTELRHNIRKNPEWLAENPPEKFAEDNPEVAAVVKHAAEEYKLNQAALNETGDQLKKSDVHTGTTDLLTLMKTGEADKAASELCSKTFHKDAAEMLNLDLGEDVQIEVGVAKKPILGSGNKEHNIPKDFLVKEDHSKPDSTKLQSQKDNPILQFLSKETVDEKANTLCTETCSEDFSDLLGGEVQIEIGVEKKKS